MELSKLINLSPFLDAYGLNHPDIVKSLNEFQLLDGNLTQLFVCNDMLFLPLSYAYCAFKVPVSTSDLALVLLSTNNRF